jgi:hypothetical protein
MKVQFLIDNDEDDDKNEWRDLWIDKSFIGGFYMPNLIDGELPCINVLYDGVFMTFLREDSLVKYLEKRFVLDG